MLPSRRARFKPFNPQQGPWLIWSHYWGKWHMKSPTDGAAGYTDDIMQAGIFDEKTARAYHGVAQDKDRRDTAIPASQMLKMFEAGLAKILDNYIEQHLKLRQIKARIAHRTSEPIT